MKKLQLDRETLAVSDFALALTLVITSLFTKSTNASVVLYSIALLQIVKAYLILDQK